MKLQISFLVTLIISSYLLAEQKYFTLHVGLEDAKGTTTYRENQEYNFYRGEKSNAAVLNFLYLSLSTPSLYLDNQHRVSLSTHFSYRNVGNRSLVRKDTQTLIPETTDATIQTHAYSLTPMLNFTHEFTSHSLFNLAIGVGIGLLDSHGKSTDIMDKNYEKIELSKQTALSIYTSCSYTYKFTKQHPLSSELFVNELLSSKVDFSLMGARLYYSYSFPLNFI